MTTHPDLEAYILGYQDDREAVEAHIAGCDECMAEVGREARLELLLHAAGREDAFAAVVQPPRRRRWPVVATAAVTVAAAAAGLALWRSRSAPETASSEHFARPGAPGRAADQTPAWSHGLEPGKVRCDEADGGLTCVAASGSRLVRDDATLEAGDLARVAMLDEVLSRGGPTITAQRAIFVQGKVAAVTARDPELFARLRHRVAEHALIGRRDSWYWEEYEKLDGRGTEFIVYVRFLASKDEIDEFLARYQGATVDGAQLVPAVPTIHWVMDPGDRLAFSVYLPGNLRQLGIRSRDILLVDPRRNANAMRALIESDQVLMWRQGLAAPVLPSTLR